MNSRIIGIDVARALSIVGMVVVNFKVVFGEEGKNFIKLLASVFDGKASATFVVLAGVGIALGTNSAIRNNDLSRLRMAQIKITKRAFNISRLNKDKKFHLQYWIHEENPKVNPFFSHFIT